MARRKKWRRTPPGPADKAIAFAFLIFGVAWLGRALFHIVFHRESSFFSEAAGATFAVIVGVVLVREALK